MRANNLRSWCLYSSANNFSGNRAETTFWVYNNQHVSIFTVQSTMFNRKNNFIVVRIILSSISSEQRRISQNFLHLWEPDCIFLFFRNLKILMKNFKSIDISLQKFQETLFNVTPLTSIKPLICDFKSYKLMQLNQVESSYVCTLLFHF